MTHLHMINRGLNRVMVSLWLYEKSPTYGGIMAHLHDNLGSHVFRCTTQSVRADFHMRLVIIRQSFRPAKPGHFDVSFGVNEHVFCFEVAIGNACFMEIAYDDDHTAEIESGHVNGHGEIGVFAVGSLLFITRRRTRRKDRITNERIGWG